MDFVKMGIFCKDHLLIVLCIHYILLKLFCSGHTFKLNTEDFRHQTVKYFTSTK